MKHNRMALAARTYCYSVYSKIIALLIFSVMCIILGTLSAQSPSQLTQRDKTDLIRDIQSTAYDNTGPNAVKKAIEMHNFELLAAGLLSPRGYVRRLCIENLDKFPEDQQKAALRACLLCNKAWVLSTASVESTSQFKADTAFAVKLKHFGISVEPVQLEFSATREAIAQRLNPTKVQ